MATRVYSLYDAHDAFCAGRLDFDGSIALEGDPVQGGKLLGWLGDADSGTAAVLRAAAQVSVGDLAAAFASLEAARAAGVDPAALDMALSPLLRIGRVDRDLNAPLRPATWLLTAGAQARSVARIEHRGGRFVGTGVVLDGRSLSPRLAGRTVVLTCAHVCCDDPGPLPAGWPAPLDPGEAEVVLPGFPPMPETRIPVAGVAWRSPVESLDACALELTSPLPPWAAPVTITAEEVEPDETRTYLIAFPEGRVLHISHEDNVVHEVGDGRMRHSLGAAPGSSGGPVFHFGDLGLMAIHRGEGGEDREAILLSAIRAQARATR